MQMKKIQDNEGQVKVFLKKSRTIQEFWKSRTFQENLQKKIYKTFSISLKETQTSKAY